ncbi:MAG: hypothetical protein H0T85_07405, partial [Geodermatophilaceae bacterium]|nr:hypothetical protein [Geodermatophilaceae bacterium]
MRTEVATPGTQTPVGRARAWCPPVALVVAGVLAGVWVTLDVILGGPWLRADIALADWVDEHDLRSRTVPNALLWVLTQTGGRGTILT